MAIVRWGMIGASTIGREWMAPAIAAQPDSVVAAVAGSDAERVRRYGRELGIPKAHASVADLLTDSEIDVVYISTTNEWHKPHTLTAARMGKHVLCEKPLALTLDGARRMVDAMTASQGMGQAGLEDAVMGVMRFGNGVLAQFHDAFTTRHAYTGFEVHGTDGSLYGRDVMTQQPRGSVTLRRNDADEEVSLDHGNLYERSVARFNAAVRGEGAPAATGEDGVRSLAIALAVRESARTGCVAKVSTL